VRWALGQATGRYGLGTAPHVVLTPLTSEAMTGPGVEGRDLRRTFLPFPFWRFLPPWIIRSVLW
jgi:hypothetical protein